MSCIYCLCMQMNWVKYSERSKLGEFQTNTLCRISIYLNIQSKAYICALILHNYWISETITKTKSFYQYVLSSQATTWKCINLLTYCVSFLLSCLYITNSHEKQFFLFYNYTYFQAKKCRKEDRLYIFAVMSFQRLGYCWVSFFIVSSKCLIFLHPHRYTLLNNNLL